MRLAASRYGYSFPCTDGTDPAAEVCVVTKPWGHGTWQIRYIDAMDVFDSFGTTPMRIDNATQSAVFNFQNTTSGEVSQVWMENPATLLYKYELLSRLQVHGVAFWTAEGAGVGNRTDASMWAGLHSFGRI